MKKYKKKKKKTNEVIELVWLMFFFKTLDILLDSISSL